MATQVDVKLLFEAVIRDAIAGINDLSSKVEAMGTRVKTVGDRMRGVGQSMLTSVTLPIVGGLGAAVKVAGDFEASLNQVRAVTGATGSNFQSLREQAKELGATTQFSASQAADAMGFLGMAGFDTQQIMAAMPNTLALAAAGNLDLARTADIASNILTGFGLEAEQMGAVADVLAKASASANTDITGLGYAMKYAAPIANATGQSFEETAALVGKLSDAGIQGEMAGTTLRGAMSRLLTPTDAVATRLEELGVTVTSGSGQLRSLVDIIRDLESAGADAADIYTIFGQEAGTGMAALLSQGSASIRELAGELSNAEGTAQQMAQTMNEGLVGQLKSLRSALEGLAIAIADTGLLDIVAKGVGLLTQAVRWIGQIPSPILKVITVIALVVAAISPVLILIGSVVSAIGTITSTLGVMVPFLTVSVIPAISGIGVAIAGLLPIIGLAVAAMGVWGYTIWQYAKTWDDVWLGIKYTASQIWKWMKTTWDDVWLGMIYTASQILEWMKTTWDDVWLGMIYTITQAKDSILKSFEGIQSGVRDAFVSIDNATGNFVSDIFKDLGNLAAEGVKIGYNFVQAIADGILGGAKLAYSAVATVTRKMRDYLPFSPAKIGALSDIDRSGSALVKTIAEGITSRPIDAALSRAFGGLNPSIAGTGNTGTTSSTSINLVYQPTINASGGDLVEILRESARELLDMLEVEKGRIERGRL